MRDRNRVILATRLRWPDGALDAVRRLEAHYPGYLVYWGEGRVTDPKPGFYALRSETAYAVPTFYGPDEAALGEILAKDTAERTTQEARDRAWAAAIEDRL